MTSTHKGSTAFDLPFVHSPVYTLESLGTTHSSIRIHSTQSQVAKTSSPAEYAAPDWHHPAASNEEYRVTPRVPLDHAYVRRFARNVHDFRVGCPKELRGRFDHVQWPAIGHHDHGVLGIISAERQVHDSWRLWRSLSMGRRRFWMFLINELRPSRAVHDTTAMQESIMSNERAVFGVLPRRLG